MTDKKETLAEDTADDSKTPAIANKWHTNVKRDIYMAKAIRYHMSSCTYF